MQPEDEVGNDMTNQPDTDERGSNDGAVLDRDRPVAWGDPQFPIAEELLRMIIGRTLSFNAKEAARSVPDEELLRENDARLESYYAEVGTLAQVEPVGLAAAIDRYREILNRIWPYEDGHPK
jgi:hypothetical protein